MCLYCFHFSFDVCMDSKKRKAKDLATDCYNLWTKWEEIQTKSLIIVENIGNKRILLLDPNASSKIDVDFDEDFVKFELTNLCEQLKMLTDEFQRIVQKFYKIKETYLALKMLINTEEAADDNEELFSSWTLDQVVDAVINVYKQMKAEVKCKLAVFETVPFADTRELVEVCTSSWAQQPYLNENEIQFLVTALATEAGLL